MSTELSTEFANAALPATLAGAFNAEQDKQELSGGVQASFAVLSVRGSKWRLKYKSQEHLLADAEGHPKAYIDVVLVKASPNLSKIFYAKAYAEGDDQTPDCYSLDSIKPDPGSMQKQCDSCAACPQNVWGSKITPTGSKTKACADARRVACVPSADVVNEIAGGPMLLRVPPASLAELANYGDRLRANGWPYYGLSTRVLFDPEASYPKLLFKEIRPLTDEEAATIMAWRSGDEVQRILSEIAGAGVDEEPATAAASAPAAAAPAAAPAPAPTPVAALVPDAPAPVAAAEPELTSGQKAAATRAANKAAKEAEAAAATPVSALSDAPAAAAAAAAAAAPAAAPAAEAAGDDIDKMISGLLG